MKLKTMVLLAAACAGFAGYRIWRDAAVPHLRRLCESNKQENNKQENNKQ